VFSFLRLPPTVDITKCQNQKERQKLRLFAVRGRWNKPTETKYGASIAARCKKLR